MAAYIAVSIPATFKVHAVWPTGPVATMLGVHNTNATDVLAAMVATLVIFCDRDDGSFFGSIAETERENNDIIMRDLYMRILSVMYVFIIGLLLR